MEIVNIVARTTVYKLFGWSNSLIAAIVSTVKSRLFVENSEPAFCDANERKLHYTRISDSDSVWI